jgi:hypothetical protein
MGCCAAGFPALAIRLSLIESILLASLDPRKPKLPHMNRELKDIIQTAARQPCRGSDLKSTHLSHCVLALATLSPQT